MWLNSTSHQYNHVDFDYHESPKRHPNETTPNDWPPSRFSHVIRLKEQALEKAYKLWADFVFVSVKFFQILNELNFLFSIE